jgi:hypothetical protein
MQLRYFIRDFAVNLALAMHVIGDNNEVGGLTAAKSSHLNVRNEKLIAPFSPTGEHAKVK